MSLILFVILLIGLKIVGCYENIIEQFLIKASLTTFSLISIHNNILSYKGGLYDSINKPTLSYSSLYFKGTNFSILLINF